MSAVSPPRQHQLNTGQIELSVLELGNSQDKPLFMVHGLRDTAWSLLPVAEHLTQHLPLRVLICELRGHGASDHSEAYGISNFLMDLHTTINHFAPNVQTESKAAPGIALFGHSLGGHIVSKFAALFPELTQAVILAEGLGPPARPNATNDKQFVAHYREMLTSRLPAPISGGRASRRKPLAGIEDVCNRLSRNNPRLDPDHAAQFAPHLTREVDGNLQWAFDSRANSVFIGSSNAENERFWGQVKAPTCVVSGSLSHEYWANEMGAGKFGEGELEARTALFENAQHYWFDRSGHMLHYDEPQRLADLIQKFLEHNYV